ncbi:hypothetical protein RchiOBHm_Chr6g0311861 [Rosa chinensis]|uniref:Uncharacterized protein n=1 Tax=Rosa chinensis TaxID=74649 RepID=A0A2P6Q1H5_ROSCH|nr:hypothetical protein RchiOBHm_Chr6g0311861 [Rosa chinensis]
MKPNARSPTIQVQLKSPRGQNLEASIKVFRQQIDHIHLSQKTLSSFPMNATTWWTAPSRSARACLNSFVSSRRRERAR